jgi:hypothetical protein
MRSFLHRIAVYVGLREDAALLQRWDAAAPDRAIRIAVWAIPALVLVAALVAALAAALWIVATTAVLREFAVGLAFLMLVGWIRLATQPSPPSRAARR